MLLLALAHDLSPDDRPQSINVERIAEATCRDWGLYTTATDNLELLKDRLAGTLEDAETVAQLGDQADKLREALERAPKTVAWKARARIGRSKRWYALPEAIGEAGDLPPSLALGRVYVPAAYEIVLDQLRRAINVGDYLPGERLPAERTLADVLGVSRVVVQRALRVLQGEGSIETRRGGTGGAFVAAPEHRLRLQTARVTDQLPQIEQELEFRLAIEPRAAALAAQRRSLRDLELLSASVETLAHAQDDPHWRRADAAFHLGIAAYSQLIRAPLRPAPR
jgi:DNA-binding transcriptional regulator YhcF (GntR family)